MADPDCVRVAIRIRPLVRSECEKGCRTAVVRTANAPQVTVNKTDAFTFNYVFDECNTQEDVYREAVYEMIDSLFIGYNVTILAYGQTGSGKTHTMGTAFDGNLEGDMGVIPRAMNDIFKRIDEHGAEFDFTVTCSFMELYQEQLFDLLSTKPRDQRIVEMREDRNRIIMPDLTEQEVCSSRETTDCLMRGSIGRAVASTAMNEQSSRSHAIFTVTIKAAKKDEMRGITTSKFHLVDLAGSERSNKTKATGDRFKEGVKINQGLLALGNVISALGTPVGDMEIQKVLKQYLSLFDSDCSQFKVYMAPNAVIDWFGRTIRGHSKIQDYLRNEVSSEYEHANFEKFQYCDSIEYKPTHMKTKIIPTGDVDNILPINKVTGIKSLKTYADSDVEDEDVDMMPFTPEKSVQTSVAINSSAAITPPASTTKIEPSGSDTESELEDVPKSTAAKRLKRSHPSPFSYLRRNQPTATNRKLVNDTGMRAFLLDESTNDEEAGQIDSVTCEYTALRYFEATGVLRAQNQTKHSGVGGTRISAAATLPSAASHYNNDTSATSWDRPVRMRISYRRRLQDEQIQFALVIYEHLDKPAESMSTRRNLMLEFSQLAAEEDDVTDDDDEDIEVIVEQQHETLIESTFLNSSSSEMTEAAEAEMNVMTTPTKLVNTPPATPKRRSRLPQSLSSIKRYTMQHSTTASASTPTPKRNAARSLRL